MNGRGTRTRVAGAALVAVALLAGACGGGDDDSADDTKRKKTSAQAETTTTTETTVVGETTTTSELAGATTTTVKRSTAPSGTRTVAPKQSSGIVNVTGAPPTTAVPSNVKKGGTLTWAARTEASAGFDPALSGSSPAAAQFRSIYDSLVETDAAGNLQARLAEAITSTDAVNWNIKLRPNVKFTDGTPLNAAAVVFNWKRIQDPNVKSPSLSAFANVNSYEAVDELNVKVNLKSPQGAFPRTVAGIGYIGSPKALADNAAAFGSNPVGAGPFVVKSFKRDDRLELERNPGFWETGKPYVDKLVIRQIAEISQRFNSIKTGDIDCGVFTEDPTIFATAKREGYLTGTNVELIGGRDVKFQTTRAPFNDVRARRALTHAIDREGFNKTVYQGAATIPQHLIQAPSPFNDPNIKMLDYDRAKAQALFNELKADGKPVEFTMLATQSTAVFAEWLQAHLQGFQNVKMDIRVIQSTQAASFFLSADFQAFATQLGGSGDPDTFLYAALRSGQPAAATRINDPELDKALDTGRQSIDFATRFAAYQTVQRIFTDKVPAMIFAGVPAGIISAKSGVKGCEVPAVSVLPYPDFPSVWLDR